MADLDCGDIDCGNVDCGNCDNCDGCDNMDCGGSTQNRGSSTMGNTIYKSICLLFFLVVGIGCVCYRFTK